MARTFKVGILGAGGFTGQELIKIFNRHLKVELAYITSSEFSGRKLSEVFPHLAGEYSSLFFTEHPKTVKDVPELHCIFLAVPDEVSLKWAGIFLEAGIRVVDISGSFRLRNKEEFAQFYKLAHTDANTLTQAVYGLTELNREKIQSARMIANPGCYPTGALLPLIPILTQFQGFSPTIIIDAKSGTSGAGGRKEKDTMGFSTVYENFRAYRVGAHQHMPEIRQTITDIISSKVQVRFTPHLLPVYRGILTNIYVFPGQKPDMQKLISSCSTFAEKETFIRFYDTPDQIELKNVQNTNFTDFSVLYDEESGVLQIISAIDNLIKGAAGQAVQNMNLMAGFSEREGLL